MELVLNDACRIEGVLAAGAPQETGVCHHGNDALRSLQGRAQKTAQQQQLEQVRVGGESLNELRSTDMCGKTTHPTSVQPHEPAWMLHEPVDDLTGATSARQRSCLAGRRSPHML